MNKIETQKKIIEIIDQLCELTPDCPYCEGETNLVSFETDPHNEELTFLCPSCNIECSVDFLDLEYRYDFGTND